MNHKSFQTSPSTVEFDVFPLNMNSYLMLPQQFFSVTNSKSPLLQLNLPIPLLVCQVVSYILDVPSIYYCNFPSPPHVLPISIDGYCHHILVYKRFLSSLLLVVFDCFRLGLSQIFFPIFYFQT